MIGVYAPNRPGFPWSFVLPLGAVILVARRRASLWFSRRLVRPLDQLADAARRFGAGDTAARADLHARRRARRRRPRVRRHGRSHRRACCASQRQLMGDVSHELRTPLARIRVALELAAEDPVAAKDVLADVGTDLDEIDQLIDDILTTARLDGEHATIDRARRPRSASSPTRAVARFAGAPPRAHARAHARRRRARDRVRSGAAAPRARQPARQRGEVLRRRTRRSTLAVQPNGTTRRVRDRRSRHRHVAGRARARVHAVLARRRQPHAQDRRRRPRPRARAPDRARARRRCHAGVDAGPGHDRAARGSARRKPSEVHCNNPQYASNLRFVARYHLAHRELKRWIPRIIVIALVAGAVAFLVIKKPWAQGRDPDHVLDRARSARARSPRRSPRTARCRRARTVQVGAQVSGRVVELHADFNDQVKKGQIIAKLDEQRAEGADRSGGRRPTTLAVANVKKARGRARSTRERQYKRQKTLQDQQLVAGATVEGARSPTTPRRPRSLAAKATSAQARANLAQAKLNLATRRSTRRSTASCCRARSTSARPSQSSLSAPTLFTIAEDLARMQIDTAVAEGDVGRLDREHEGDVHRRRVPRQDVRRHRAPGPQLADDDVGRRHLRRGDRRRQPASTRCAPA